MKKLSTALCIGLALSGTTAFAKGMDSKMMESKMKAPDAVFVDSSEIKWMDVAEFPGVQHADVEGNSMKGPHHAFMKFKAGFNAPMHTHTANHYVTTLAGTFILTTPDGVEHKLSPGSFFSFKNKAKHSTKCAEGADCIISLDVRGKWDVVPEKQNAIGSK